MAKKKWNELSTGAKVSVVGVAMIDAGLRVWAVQDLASRPKSQVKGPKWAWGLGLSVLSTSGVLPAAYLLVGRNDEPGLLPGAPAAIPA